MLVKAEIDATMGLEHDKEALKWAEFMYINKINRNEGFQRGGELLGEEGGDGGDLLERGERGRMTAARHLDEVRESRAAHSHLGHDLCRAQRAIRTTHKTH